MEKKTLGVIGGMGPITTSHFIELVIRMTQAELDQEHIDMIVYHAPSIPDRSSHILDKSRPSPLPELIRLGRLLACQEVGCVAIPCVTAHYFHRALSSELSCPVLNAVELTARHLSRAGVKCAGIMATSGTIAVGLFQQALAREGIQSLVPDDASQADIMALIFENIKAGKPVELERFYNAANRLRAGGAEVIILGCTELSLIKRDFPLGPGFLDSLEVLARQVVVQCGAELKPEYQTLITT